MRIAHLVTSGSIALVALMAAGDACAQSRVTSNFGYRKDPFHGGQKFHAGMDFGAAAGTPVYATGDGYVRRSRWAGGYGNLVEIEHGFGYQSRFGHLSRSLVTEGQFVRRGQMVGLVGSTGRSTAPHLHYEVRVNGHPTQPSEHLQIVFSTQPDWRMVQASLFVAAPTYSQRPAVVAMARAVPRSTPRYQTQRISADIDLDLGGTSVGMTARARPSNSFGMVSGVRRP